jgi:molecular chaperone GrpE
MSNKEKVGNEKDKPMENELNELNEQNVNEAVEESKEDQSLADRVIELEAKNKELNDRLLRRLAEFENYKKRTEQDQLNILKYAAEPFILNVLSIYDDLERSLSHIDEENRQSLVDGLKMIHDKFTKILGEQGVEKLKSKGEQFDFNLHEALMRQPSNDHPANTVVEEIEPGYIYKDKVIKHAKVIVSEEVDITNEESNSDKD